MIGQKISETWIRNIALMKRAFPNVVERGVADQGMKYQIGPVTRESVIIKATKLEKRALSELGEVLSFLRFELYQIF